MHFGVTDVLNVIAPLLQIVIKGYCHFSKKKPWQHL